MGDIPTPQSNYLWARSRGTCAHPTCGKALVVLNGAKRVTLGERAHIRSSKPGGPRHDASYGNADRYENLVLLCLDHHTLIDSQPGNYPVALLEQWKADHEGPEGLVPTAWLVPPPLSTRYRRRPEYSEVAGLTADRAVTVIAGLSGSGKTHLAADFFFSAADDFTIRAWLRASDPDALIEDYTNLGSLLNVRPQSSAEDRPSFAGRIRAALEASSGWLLVFDDAPDVAAVDRYCPSAGGASLVTTQSQGWFDYPVVSLGPMPRDDSIELLATNQSFAEDPGSASRAAELLGDLPLALTQALGYVSATGMSAAGITALVEANAAKMMARGEPPDHAALQAVVERCIAALTPGGRSLLRALAHLAALPLPVPVPSDPTVYGEVDPWVIDLLELEDAIADLRRFSLIERNEGQVSIHSLIQAIALNQASPEDARKATFNALLAIESRLPERVNREDHVSEAAALLPHARALVGHLAKLPETGIFSARILNRLAPVASMRRDETLERALFDQALELARSDSQPDLVLVGSILSNLSNHVIRSGDIPGAIALAREALDNKRAGGADEFTLGITVGALGTHLEFESAKDALDCFEEATGLLREAGAVRDLAESLLDEARALRTLGRSAEASTAATRALEVASSEADAWSERSSAHIALAHVAEMTDVASALDHARSAVREAEFCGLPTRCLAIGLGTRGRLRGHTGEKAEAIVDLRRACELFLELEGESQDYSMTLGNLGVALIMLAEESGVSQVAGEGLSLMRHSRDLLVATCPTGHPVCERAEVMLQQAQAHVLGRS